jgi:predicted secreted hydrolase
MKSKVLAIMIVVCGCLVTSRAQYQVALPGYRYEFPRDHFNHPEYQTEWWYYTGNLKGADGHRFGFELTFFREAVDRSHIEASPWDVRDVYLAHFAVSDLDGGEFYHAERTNRAGPGIAGVDESKVKIWNGNWQALWKGKTVELKANDERFAVDLVLRPEKAPVIQGENGVSQKAAGVGHASHYISLTRLKTSGSMTVGKTLNKVTGSAWMDHEFFTHQLEAEQVGWDWLSLQLNDNTELMLFHIRRKDGSIDPFSAGTYVDALGGTVHLHEADFVLRPAGDTWISAITKARYPVRWHVEIPKLSLSFEITTPLKPQELSGRNPSSPNYWEGAITLAGTRGNSRVSGVGYLEMTGYDRAVILGGK